MKKYLIPLVLVLAIVAAYYIAFGNPFKKADPDSDKQPAADSGNSGKVVNGSFTTPAATAVKKDAYGFPLSEGSTGTYVSNLQKALNSRYGSSLTVDGIFGPKTAKALSANGFNPTAIYWKHYYEILGVKI